MKTDNFMLVALLVIFAGNGVIFQTPAAIAVSSLAGSLVEEPEKSLSVESIRVGLMSALGDSFEYLGGENGKINQNRFWFAKVRPGKAGEYAVSYTVGSDSLPDDQQPRYKIRIKIGERHTQRVLLSDLSDMEWPLANVGDTVVIPILLDPHRSGQTFVKANAKEDLAYFKNPYRSRDFLMKQVSAEPVVRNDASDWVELLASLNSSDITHSGLDELHAVTAFLEFRKAGEVSLEGKLADRAHGLCMPFRVFPKDEPITVVVKCSYGGLASWSGRVPPGTLQVRVGDLLILNCGSYDTILTREKTGQARTGVVTVCEFKDIEPFIR
jgi:hypothetical protein